MGKILDVFGKESGIGPSDIDKKFIEEHLQKSATIEYKVISKKTPMADARDGAQSAVQRLLSDKLKEEIILRPIVGFLNSIGRQSALLVLGVEAKGDVPVDVVPFPTGLLSEEKIRSWVSEYAGSLPEIPTPFPLKIVQVEYPHDKCVILVEVNPPEEAVYYSRLENRCYIRRDVEAVDLPLGEFYALVEARSIPLTYLKIGSRYEGKSEDGVTIKIRLAALFVNRGARPAKDVVSTISIGARNCDASKVSITADKAHFTNISELNPKHLHTYQIKAVDVIYPGINTLIDNLSVAFPAGGVLTVVSRTCDCAGISRQYWEVDGTGIISEMHTDHRRWGQAKPVKEE
jgi:hypothetical protein